MLVERTRLHVHVAGLFYAPVFGPNEIQLVKKEGRRSCVNAFLVTFVCAARQGCLHHDMAYAWGMDCRPVALKLRQEGCLFTCNGGSEPFNRLLETNMVAACWLMMLRTETAK